MNNYYTNSITVCLLSMDLSESFDSASEKCGLFLLDNNCPKWSCADT